MGFGQGDRSLCVPLLNRPSEGRAATSSITGPKPSLASAISSAEGRTGGNASYCLFGCPRLLLRTACRGIGDEQVGNVVEIGSLTESCERRRGAVLLGERLAGWQSQHGNQVSIAVWIDEHESLVVHGDVPAALVKFVMVEITYRDEVR